MVSTPLRILHLVSYPLYSGPLPSTLGLAQAQRALGHTVWLAFDSKRGAFNDYEEAAAPWLDGLDFEPSLPFTLSAKSSPIEYLRDLRSLRRLIGGGEIDVVHAHLSHDHGLLALAGNGGGKVIRVRTFHADRSLSSRFGQRWLNRRANGWILRTEEHRERLRDLLGMAANRTCVIPGGIDLDRFQVPSVESRRAARRRFDLPEDAKVVTQVALIAGRGQEELVDAAVKLGETAPFLLFVGRGENEASLKERVEKSGMRARVRFAGYLQGADLLDAYAAADAAFVAQPGNDASARAALEAMACALPVIAVQTGALADLVDETVGYLVKGRDASLIAAALEIWVSDPSSAQRGAAGRVQVSRERTFVREAGSCIEFYQTLR